MVTRMKSTHGSEGDIGMVLPSHGVFTALNGSCQGDFKHLKTFHVDLVLIKEGEGRSGFILLF